MKVYGPYERSDGRKHVILYDPDTKKRRTVSYPKFLLEQKLGRELAENETADHVDEDFTNDDPNNLQPLSRADNARKSIEVVYGKKEEQKCPFCKKLYMPKRRGQKYCSYSCNSNAKFYEPMPG